MRAILSSLLLFCVLTVNAQENALLNKFIEGISNSCVVIDYTYTARISGIDNIGSGTLVSQGDMWAMEGNGVQMYCDGQSAWIVDASAKEVIIEPVSAEQGTEYLTNPALLALNATESFNLNAVNLSSDGKAQRFSLKPKKKSDIEYLNVEILSESALIRNMSFALNDGTLVTIKVSSMKLTPKVSVETFMPQTVFDSKWIVTDLR